MCFHLELLEVELLGLRVKKTYEGQGWSNNCNVWKYYDCFIDAEKVKQRLNLPAFVVVHSNDDPRSGLEYGLVCKECNDAIMGVHPSMKENKFVVV
jgi:hypothetical protein